MKNLRTKLFAAVSMLMISALMLTTASFAWFTISTAPEVSNINTTLAANKNLEIMLDDGYSAGTGTESSTVKYADNTSRTIGVGVPASTSVDSNAKRNVYWGNLVDLKDYDQFGSDVMLQPAVWQAKATDKDPGVMPLLFALDGRIEGTEAIASDYTSDVGVVRLYKEVVTGADDEKTEVFYGYRIDLWMRSNTAGNVSLTDKVVRGDSVSEEGLGSWIDNKFLEVYIQVGNNDPVQVTKATSVTANTNHYQLTKDSFLTFVSEANNVNNASAKYIVNEAVPVHVYVFYDAASLTNADLAENGTNGYAQLGNINLQFTHSGVSAEDAYQVTETNNYGRQAAN